MSDQNKLLPCPFCGGAAILEPATGYDEYVSCSTPCCPAERLCASSVEKWNRRAALDRTEQNAAPQTPCTYDEGHHSGLSESSGSAKASKFPSGASHLVMANHLVPAQSAGAAPDKADAMPGAKMLNDIEWEKLDAAYNAATGGDWSTHYMKSPDGHALAWFGNHYIDTDAPKVGGTRYKDPRADADFCATMHNIYPTLRAYALAQKEHAERFREELNEWMAAKYFLDGALKRAQDWANLEQAKADRLQRERDEAMGAIRELVQALEERTILNMISNGMKVEQARIHFRASISSSKHAAIIAQAEGGGK